VSRRSLPPAPARPRAVPRDPARPGGPALDAAGLAARLEAGRVSQSVGPHLEVLREWRSRRDDLLPGAAPRDVARLDAALALHGVLEGGADAAVLHPALQSLREAGEHGAAARYELSALPQPVEGPEPPDGDALPGRLDALLAEADADAGDTVVVAVLGVLQAAARRGLLAPEVARARFTAELERGLRLLEAAAPDDLTPPRRGTLALLRVQDAARPLPAEARLERLRAAWSLLPAGMRAHERAVVGSELAPALAEARDLDGALAVLAEVVDDARTAADPGLAARALAMSARVHQHRGEHPAAVERLLQADRRLHEDLPALDPATRPAHPDPVEVAALRRDLALALQAAGRITEAAEVAETAVRGVEDHLAEQGVAPAPPPPDGDLADLVHGRAAPPEGGVPLDGPLVPAVRAAGTVSYVAATCCAELGERDRATSHALRSAAWHRLTGWRGAEAEALDLAGRAERDGDRALRLLLRAAAGYDEDGGRQEACRCRRQASGRAVELGLVSEALAVLDTLRTSLDSVPEGDVAAVAWERLALTEQSARVLAMAGRADEAFPLLDGLAEAYRELGDVGSVWDVALLRAESLAALDRAEEGLAELRAAAEEALTAGSPARARDLGGRLVDLLDDLGRPEEAEQAWSRYRGGAG